MTRLRAVLELLAAHGGGEIRACELDAALAEDGPDVRSALRTQGIVRDAPRATSVPCDGLGCAREVRELRRSDGEPRRLFGVCTRAPAECETIDVSERDVAVEILSRETFVAAVQRALKITPVPGAAGASDTRDAADVTVLGEELVEGAARDVLLAWRAESPALRAMVAERTSRARATSVLTLAALADLLTVRDGQIAELPRLRVAGRTGARDAAEIVLPALATANANAAATPSRSPALHGMREITRWNEVTLFEVDEEDLIGVALGDNERLRRVSCVDFGLARVDGRKPLDVFELLRTVCRGNGDFTTRAFGSRENGKRLVSLLRTAMRATFGLASDPFEKYSYREHGWKPKFRALAAPPSVIEAAKRELAGRNEAR